MLYEEQTGLGGCVRDRRDCPAEKNLGKGTEKEFMLCGTAQGKHTEKKSMH